jgi:hypothetical protein
MTLVGYQASAISMTPVTLFSGKRDFHDVCDLVFRQSADSMTPVAWVSDKARFP